MTSPLAGAGAVSPHVTQVGGGLEDYLPLILQALQASRARKERQAREAVGQIKPGTKGKELTPQQKKAYKRDTGTDVGDEQEVSPLPPSQTETDIAALEKRLGISPTSTFSTGLRIAAATREATGKPTAPTTVEAVEAETRTSADVALARESQARSFKTGTEKVEKASAAGKPADLTEAELIAIRGFNDFVPSEAVAKQLTGRVQVSVMKEALRVAADPDSTTWAGLLPAGVKPSDVIGGIALGAGSLIESGASRKNMIEATIAQEAARALYATYEAISKDMKGAYSPTFLARVGQGDPEVLKTDAGQMALRFMQSGFKAAFQEQIAKGDPRFAAIKTMLELARIPQITSVPATLASTSQMFQDAQAAALTSGWLGYERPQETGDQQKVWDKAFAEIKKQTLGVFKAKGGLFGLGQHPEAEGPAGATPSKEGTEDKKRQEDMQIIEGTLKALFPDTLTRPTQTKKRPTGAGGTF